MDLEEDNLKAGNLKTELFYYKHFAQKRKKGDLLNEYIEQKKEQEKKQHKKGRKSNYSREKIAEYLDINVYELGRMLSGEHREFEDEGVYEEELEKFLDLEEGCFDLEKDRIKRGYIEYMKQKVPGVSEEEILELDDWDEMEQDYTRQKAGLIQLIKELYDELDIESCCFLATYLTDFLNIPSECRIFLIFYIKLETDDRKYIRKKMQEFHIPVSSVNNKLSILESLDRLAMVEKKNIRAVLARDESKMGQAGETTKDRQRKVKEQYKQIIQDGLEGRCYDDVEKFCQWFRVYLYIKTDEWWAMGEFYLLNSTIDKSSRWPFIDITLYQRALLDEMLDRLNIQSKDELDKNDVEKIKELLYQGI